MGGWGKRMGGHGKRGGMWGMGVELNRDADWRREGIKFIMCC